MGLSLPQKQTNPKTVSNQRRGERPETGLSVQMELEEDKAKFEAREGRTEALMLEESKITLGK